MRRFASILVAVVMMFGWVAQARAANYYAISAVMAASTASNFLGGFAKWKTPSKYTTTDGGFTAQVLWVGTQNDTSDSDWVEVGLTKGWAGDNATWTMYWAEATPSYNEYKVTSVSPGATGSTHLYQVQYDSYNKWGAYIDYTKVGTSSQATGSMYVSVGSESTSTSNTLTTTYPSYMQCYKSGWKYWKDCGGTIGDYDDSPFVWSWLDAGTYKLGKTTK